MKTLILKGAVSLLAEIAMKAATIVFLLMSCVLFSQNTSNDGFINTETIEFSSPLIIEDCGVYLCNEVYVVLHDDAPIIWEEAWKEFPVSIIPGLVELQEEFGLDNFLPSMFFAKSESLKRTLRLRFSASEKRENLIEALQKLPLVKFAEAIPCMTTTIDPNDSEFNDQWAYDHVDAGIAHEYYTGDNNIVVVVVDDAFQTGHPDLNGTFISGRNMQYGNSNVEPPTSQYGHGTHVSGSISAKTNNNIGVASIGYGNIKMMPIKVTDGSLTSNGQLSFVYAYEGLLWGAQYGGDIINNSWGGTGYSSVNQNVIDEAYSYGCIIVAAAGNEGNSENFYPAAYDNVIAVANSNQSDNRNSSSTYGSFVDLTAPGTSIYSTEINSNYGNKTGTSMSSPHVAATLALLWSYGNSLSRDQIINCLYSGCTSLNWWGSGAGLLNVNNALECVMSLSGGNPIICECPPAPDQYPSGTVYPEEYIQTISCQYAGEYCEVFLEEGVQFHASYCNSHGGEASDDRRLNVFDDNWEVIACNTDYCNLDPYVNFIAPYSGNYYVQTNEYINSSNQCAYNSECGDLAYWIEGGNGGGDMEDAAIVEIVMDPNNFSYGESITIDVLVENLGLINLDDVYIVYYWNTVPYLNGQEIEFGDDETAFMEPEEDDWESQSIDTNDLPCSGYFIVVLEINDDNQSNNMMNIPFTVDDSDCQEGEIDAGIVTFSMTPNSFGYNTTVELDVLVENYGTAFLEPVPVIYAFSPSPYWTNDSFIIGDDDTSSLDPGEDDWESQSFNSNILPCEGYILVIIDWDDVNNSNNLEVIPYVIDDVECQDLVCEFSLNENSQDFSSEGGNGSVWVSTNDNSCEIMVQESCSWVSFTEPLNNGSQSVSYTVSPNFSTSSRTCQALIGGEEYSISQSGINCTLTLGSNYATHNSSASSGSFNVFTPNECEFDISENCPFVTLSSTSGSGNQTVTYSISENTNLEPRNCNITIGSAVFQITQEGVSCQYNLNENASLIGPDGGTFSNQILTESPCEWSFQDVSNWIDFSNTSGQGTQSLIYTVEANPSSLTRSQTFQIESEYWTITQTGQVCDAILNNASDNYNAEGGNGNVIIDIPDDCFWSVQGVPSWIIFSEYSGLGSLTLEYQVLNNSSSQNRGVVIQVAGVDYLVSQGGINCTYDLSDYSAEFSHEGGEGLIELEVNSFDCESQVSNVPDWITFVETNGTGNTDYAYVVEPNNQLVSRTAYLNFGSLTFVLIQDGLECQSSLSETSLNVGSGYSVNNLFVSMNHDDCEFIISESSDWLTILSPLNGTGSTEILFEVEENTLTTPRVAVIFINGQSYIVTQEAQLPCEFTLSSDSEEVSVYGGELYVEIDASSESCFWNILNSCSYLSFPIGVEGEGSDVVHILVDENLGDARVCPIYIGGQSFVIHQEGVTECQYELEDNIFEVDPDGEVISVEVYTAENCAWSAIEDSEFIQLLGLSEGEGEGSITFQVQVNQETNSRIAEIQLADQVIVIVQDGLTTTVSNTLMDPVIDLYPNPVREILTIELSGNTQFKTYEIYDLAGRRVRMGYMNSSAIANLDFSQFTRGMYVLRLVGDNDVFDFRVMKE